MGVQTLYVNNGPRLQTESVPDPLGPIRVRLTESFDVPGMQAVDKQRG